MVPTVNDYRDGPRDECGVFGIFAPGHDVARGSPTLRCSRSSTAARIGRHRHRAAWRDIMAIREQGLVAQVFNEHKLRSLIGDIAIGHVRYSTTGTPSGRTPSRSFVTTAGPSPSRTTAT